MHNELEIAPKKLSNMKFNQVQVVCLCNLKQLTHSLSWGDNLPMLAYWLSMALAIHSRIDQIDRLCVSIDKFALSAAAAAFIL